MHFDRAFLVGHVVEEAYDRAAGLEPSNGAVFADQDGRQMAAVAVGQLVRAAVVNSQEERGIFFRRSAFVELVVEQAEQGSGRNLDALQLTPPPTPCLSLRPRRRRPGSRIWGRFSTL